MNHVINTVVVNGGLSRPSRTRALLDAVHHRLVQDVQLDTTFIDLSDLIEHIGNQLWRDSLPLPALNAIQAIENADFLIVGTPVFRGSLPGLLKHLFDLVELQSLNGKPVLLAASGGSARHSLVIDHQLRPLFGFFQALTLPIGVYATPEDIIDEKIVNDALTKRIDLAVSLAAPILHSLSQTKPKQVSAADLVPIATRHVA